MLNATNANYTNLTRKHVLLSKEKGNPFPLVFSMLGIMCKNPKYALYKYWYFDISHDKLSQYLYQQHKTRENRSFLRFRFGNKHPQNNSLSHSVAATFSRFWRGSQSSVNGSMSFRARRGCFGHLGKWSSVRPRRPIRPRRSRGFSWQVLSNVVGVDGGFSQINEKTGQNPRTRMFKRKLPENCKTAPLSYSTLSYSSCSTLSFFC